MSIVPLFRFASLTALAGSIASIVLGGGAFAQSVYVPAAAPNTAIPVSQQQPTNQSFEPAGSDTTALNWAGYTATGGTYTSVSGSWIVPSVSANESGTVADATWVGIGGVLSNDLIQAGTEAIPDSNGTLVYRAWMETLPEGSQMIPVTISPGDAVSVSITQESSGLWDVSFDDATTGKTYQTTVRYNSSLSSADWIEEMPVEVGGVVGLDDFGTVDFTSGNAIKNGQLMSIASSGATPLTMANSAGMTVAQPSALDATGSSFSVSRTNAASTPLALAGDGISAVAIGASPYTFAQTGNSHIGGSYTVHLRRGRGGYRTLVQF